MHIRREHHFELDDVRERVDELAADLEKRFMLHSEWQDEDHLVFSGSGASGYVVFDEEIVELKVKLGFALKLIEPTLRAVIEETLDEHINSANR